MARKNVLWLPFCLMALAIGLFMALNACGGGSTSSTTPPPVQSKIQHVVIIFQENRTPDNLFQDPKLVAAGADIAASGKNHLGQVIALTPTTLQTDYDLGHSHPSFTVSYNKGGMDGFDLNNVSCAVGAKDCPRPNMPYQYINPSEVGPYFELAETYTFGDRMFQTNQGPSFPAHQFIISGTSAPTATSNLFAAENPELGPDPFNNAGCIAPLEERVKLIDPSGSEAQEIYPCFDHPTLTDVFNAAKISWRYYAPLPGIIWNAPTAIQHMCVPNSTNTSCTGSDWTNNVVLTPAQVLNDVSGSTLATVNWVIPTGQNSDHPLSNDGGGPSWVASVVNAIGNSQYWANTAIIITWDDWGGWYDHVAPPSIINSYEYGFRVPLIVVSPYAKPAFISHQFNDFGSILKFIEGTFGLPQVAPGASPPYADALSTSGDLSDCFNFNQTPLTFKTINAPLKAQFFLNDKREPLPPDDD